METENRLQRVEHDVVEVKKSLAVIHERQVRMHQDFSQLTEALHQNTKEIATLNQFVANKRGFATGVVTVVTLFGGAVGAIVWTFLEWVAR